MLTIEDTPTPIVHLVLDGEIEEKEIDRAASVIKQKLTQSDKVRLLLEVKDMKGYDSVSAFLEDSGKTIEHYRDFEKIAIVTGEQWLSGLANLTDLINPANTKQFSPSEKAVAEEWIKQ